MVEEWPPAGRDIVDDDYQRGLDHLPDRRHIIEEYRYGTGPSWGKFKASTASLLDVVTIAIALWASLRILLVRYPQGLYGWTDALVLVISLLVVKNRGTELYIELWRPMQGQRRGTFKLSRPTEPFWVAEIDRAPTARPGTYHREFVSVSARSQPDAIDAIVADHDTSEDNIITIRHVSPEIRRLSNGSQLRSNALWTDESDDPSKAYTTWQLGRGTSCYLYGPTGSTVCHSIAGLSNAYVRILGRSYPEMIAEVELHELSHWALGPEEQPQSHSEEDQWDRVLWDVIDYVQDEPPDGPHFHEERRKRLELTSREQRENAVERTPSQTERRAAPPAQSGSD